MHAQTARPESRCYVYSADHQIVNQSRNLAGIRRYVSGHAIAELHIAYRAGHALTGWLYIVFTNGSHFQTTFASYSVLADFVRRWRNVYGAELWIGGHKSNTPISAGHPSLTQIANNRSL
jgi:hypothetical protein